MGGGGAVRAIHQSGGPPVYIVTSTFDGQEGLSNRALSGSAPSGVEVPFVVVNSLFTDNQAVAHPMVNRFPQRVDSHLANQHQMCFGEPHRIKALPLLGEHEFAASPHEVDA